WPAPRCQGSAGCARWAGQAGDHGRSDRRYSLARMPRSLTRHALAALAALTALSPVACDEGAVPPTPPIVPGASAAPREVNIVARDYQFSPPTVDFVPGETVLLHVVNGG